MSKHKASAITTDYWRPNENYLEKIIEGIRGRISDGDVIVVSEKAILTASNRIVDEKTVEPNLTARFIVRFWMRAVWGYLLGPLCHFQESMLQRLRDYPLEEGSRHKQVALEHAGLLQALMFGSEGGIDGSNLAYSYVSLSLNNASENAEAIHKRVLLSLRKRVVVMIADTDKTYSIKSFHFTPRPRPLRGIHSFGGVFAYVIGRMFGLRRRATPLALAGCRMPVETALEIAELSNRARGYGAGRNVWDMAEKFKVGLAEVSWEMLETVRHKPIVIVRSKKGKNADGTVGQAA